LVKNEFNTAADYFLILDELRDASRAFVSGNFTGKTCLLLSYIYIFYLGFNNIIFDVCMDD
jgi:hypothetical protein